MPDINSYLDYLYNLVQFGGKEHAAPGTPAYLDVVAAVEKELRQLTEAAASSKAAYDAATTDLNAHATAYQDAHDKLNTASSQYADAAAAATEAHGRDAAIIGSLTGQLNKAAGAANANPVSTAPAGLTGPSLLLALGFFGALAYYFGPKLLGKR